MKTYYSLLTFDHGRWSVQFGGYDKEVVKDERRDWFDSDPEMKTMIVRSGDSQSAIEAAVAKLNGV